MTAPEIDDPSRSLLSVTVRRASITGRFFLVYGSAISVLLGVILAHFSGPSFSSSFALFVPIFGVVGSMGGLLVFTSDRTKGVLEYLIAYGYSPRRLFANVLLTTLVLVSIVVGIGLSASLAVYFAEGNTVTSKLAIGLGVYAVPMTFACASFASTVGVYWTTLSSPRQGINSPIGLIPFIGILPALVTLFVIVALGLSGPISTTTLLLVLGSGMGLVAILVIVLLVAMGRLLRRERFLSPA
ncbi:MAG TPA: hypothetical protein VEH57_04215 [Thermoplasmata archaeon]|nr:hypothetical protein [Thermoplasmata archaeon]